MRVSVAACVLIAIVAASGCGDAPILGRATQQQVAGPIGPLPMTRTVQVLEGGKILATFASASSPEWSDVAGRVRLDWDTQDGHVTWLVTDAQTVVVWPKPPQQAAQKGEQP